MLRKRKGQRAPTRNSCDTYHLGAIHHFLNLVKAIVNPKLTVV